jgi:hypothetical protein
MDSELPSTSFFDRFTHKFAFSRTFFDDFSKLLYGDP